MATIKVKFRPSTTTDAEGTIFYQILHDRIPRQLLTDYKVWPAEWDERHSTGIAPQKSKRYPLILSIRERIRWDVERLTMITRRLDKKGRTYTADDVINQFNRYANDYTLFNFMESQIIKLKQNYKTRTAAT